MTSCNRNMADAPNDGTPVWLTNDFMEKSNVAPKLGAWGWFVSPDGEFKRGWYTLKCKAEITPDRWCQPKEPSCFAGN